MAPDIRALPEKMSQDVKCLVVDDEPAVLRLVEIVLADMGCGMLAAPDAETALEMLFADSPDFVLTDLRLPGMDGLELARRIKDSEQLSSTPVLLMSAFAEPPSHSCEGFLAKPFDIERLAEFVEPYLGAQSSSA